MIHRISLDNPLYLGIIWLATGTFAYMALKVSIDKINIFDLVFVSTNILLTYFFVSCANALEKTEIRVKFINPFFAIFIIAINVYLLLLTIKAGAASGFDDRLAIRGSSFINGLDMAFSLLLFPILPIFVRSNFLRLLAFGLWLSSEGIVIALAPSKSSLLSLAFSLLWYRFLLRKTGRYNFGKITGLAQLLPLLIIVFLTIFFAFVMSGLNGLQLIVFRVAYNFDGAFYYSQLSGVEPPHNIFYYGVLPILKMLDPGLRDLEFFSIPQWILYERFEISRYGRFGFPNDNLLVGAYASFKWFSVFIVLLVIFWLRHMLIRRIARTRIGAVHLYFIIMIPLYFSAFQDTMIKTYAVLLVWMCFETFGLIMPKKQRVIT